MNKTTTKTLKERILALLRAFREVQSKVYRKTPGLAQMSE